MLISCLSIVLHAFNFHHRVVETNKNFAAFFYVFTLTFTIGWLKRSRLHSFMRHIRGFNFHHRVVETGKISRQHSNNRHFNFHHRVVETRLLLFSFAILMPLTFTIGWLKPISGLEYMSPCSSLTFTIGWLKLIAECHTSTFIISLTFTIGWLKPVTCHIRFISSDFNFHHRVVETLHSFAHVLNSSTL